MRRVATTAVSILALLSCAGPLMAQSPLPAEPTATPPSTIGPVALYPRFEVTSIGVDTNVFNEAEDPKQDFTIAARPSIEARLRFGPGRLSYRSSMDANYFHEYKEERSLDRFGEVRAELRLTRLMAHVATGGLEASNRPNQEIDLRADRSLRTYSAGAMFAVLSRTALVVAARQEKQQFALGQIFREEDLAEQLNNTLEAVDGGVRIALTTLTTFTLTASRERSTFEYSPDRNSTTFRITPRFEFDPNALLSGTAAVGFRKFTPSDPTLEGFTGVVADVGVSYTRDRLRVALKLRRDLDYSVEEREPYYVATTGSVVLTRKVGGPFDVQVLGSLDRFQYKRFNRLDDAGLPPPGIDTTKTIGGGIGYLWRETTRLGLTYEWTSRHAEQTARPYERTRLVGSFTYGF